MLMSKIDGWRGRPRQGPGIGYWLRLALSKPPKVNRSSSGITYSALRTYMYDDERMRTARASRHGGHGAGSDTSCDSSLLERGIEVPRCSERPILNTRGDSGLAIVFFRGLSTALDERKRGSSNIVGCTCVCASVRVCAYPLRFPRPPIQFPSLIERKQ